LAGSETISRIFMLVGDERRHFGGHRPFPAADSG
jgi:hypothetical protein